MGKKQRTEKNKSLFHLASARFNRDQKMRLIGIEPTHAAPEATALSTELQTHLYYITILFKKLQLLFLFPILFSDLFYLFSNELPFFSLTYEKIMLKWHLLLIYYKSVKYYYYCVKH